MGTGRRLIERLQRGEPAGRAAYVPFFSAVVARIGGTSVEAMTADAGAWTGCLVKTAELLDLDGVVAGFDNLLVAQACGCEVERGNGAPVAEPLAGSAEGRFTEGASWQTALEAARRVFHACRHERMCLAALAGPLSSATQVFGAEAALERAADIKGPLVRLAEAFCETRPDILCLVETGTGAAGEISPAFRRLYQTLRNVASYYDIPVALYSDGYQPDLLEAFARLNLDIYLLGPGREGGPPAEILAELGSRCFGVGLGLPIDDLEQARRLIEVGREAHGRSHGRAGLFFTSHEAASCHVDIDKLHDLVREIGQGRL